ncbi:MAG TPA: aminotransferase class I/II-fold pyridoxal phosphate-dependent enzyme [Candidatus Ozemobacteraceae bacterium]|nr:aminotransferase class I/II-fold pyridoxal phosphate-dependent enzyme [Candidatus Ozemobacteraceae bacterium]
MRYAKRVDMLSPSSIRQMMAIAKRLIGEGKTVYELNIGQPDIKCIPVFPEAIAERAREGHLGYSPFIGEQFLRETFARYLNAYFGRNQRRHLVIDTANVLVTCGASQALTNTFLAICEPGEEVLGIEPFFSPYSGFLAVSGGVLKTVPTFAEQGFVLPPDDVIEKQIGPKTRAILFNSPCNPSGKIFTPDEVTRLAKLAIKHDLFLIADEVYREMILGDEEAFSVLQVELPGEQMESLMNRIIVIDSASKSFSLCGARVGFVVARAPIIQKIAMVQAHTVASVSDVLQYGVARAYDYVLGHPEFFAEMRKIYRDRLDAAMEAIREFMPWVVAPRPSGAFYLMIQFPGIDDINDFALFLLEKFNIGTETVCITPAMSFYQTPGRGTNEVRLALVVDPDKIRRSIFIIAEACKVYKARLTNHKGLHALA